MIITFIAAEKRVQDASRVYRCNNQAEQLKKYGWETHIFNQFEINFNIVKKTNIIVYQRCIFDKDILKSYKIAKSCGATIITDFDDLIFLLSTIKLSGGVRSKVVKNLKHRYNITLGILKMIPLSDYTIVSTEELSDQIKKLGGNPIISKNAINDNTLKINSNPRKGPLRNILYMSGTRTHNNDFLVMCNPLLDFLIKYPDVKLTLLGEIDVPKEFHNLPNVFFQKKLEYSEMFNFISTFDISLVPLEDTIFNNAKSSLKFYESGYVNLPIIASPRREFLYDIENKVNGFIAYKERDWFNILEEVYNNEELLYTVKINSKNYVLKNYTISGRNDYLSNTLEAIWKGEKTNKYKI